MLYPCPVAYSFLQPLGCMELFLLGARTNRGNTRSRHGRRRPFARATALRHAPLGLAVESQQVVLRQAESANWDFIIDAGVRPVPIVAVQPERQLDPALSGVTIGLCVGPFAQAGLDEALGLSIGLWRVWLGPDVTEPEPLAGSAEGEGFIAGAVIGHDALDFDAEAFVVGQCGLEEGDGAALLLIGHYLGESDAGMIVDGDMDELPADTSAVALAFAVAGDAVADFVETAELFDVDVDHLAGLGPLVAADRVGRFQGADSV